MRVTTNDRYGLMANGIVSRGHVGSSSWTTFHILSGAKPAAIMASTAHRRTPEVLLT